MIDLIKQNKLFFILFALYLIVGGAYLYTHTHAHAVLYFAARRTPTLNFLSMYGTHIGDGLFYIAVIAGLCLVSVRLGAVALICYAVPSLVAQFLKRIVFSDHLRPSGGLGIEAINAVDSVEMHTLYSFPSGHSTSAFSLALLLAFTTRHKYLSVVFFAMALFTTFTRVYLAQHYFQDTYAGALLGVVLTLISYFYASKYLIKQDLPCI